MAALLAFVSLSALFMGLVAFSAETDSTNRLLALGIFVPLVLATFEFAVGL